MRIAEIRTGAQDLRTKSHGIMSQLFIQILQQFNRRLNLKDQDHY